MNRNLIIAFFLLLPIFTLAQTSNSQKIISDLLKNNLEDLVLFKDANGLYGFTNSMTAEIAVKPIFKYISDINRDKIIFKTDLYSILFFKKNGRIIFNETNKFQNISFYDNNNRFHVTKNDKAGVVDSVGTTIVPFKYNFVWPVTGESNYYSSEINGNFILIKNKEDFIIETGVKGGMVNLWDNDTSYLRITIRENEDYQTFLFSKKTNKIILKARGSGFPSFLKNNTNFIILKSDDNDNYRNQLYSIKKDSIVMNIYGDGYFDLLKNNSDYIVYTERQDDGEYYNKVYSINKDSVILTAFGSTLEIYENKFWKVDAKDGYTYYDLHKPDKRIYSGISFNIIYNNEGKMTNFFYENEIDNGNSTTTFYTMDGEQVLHGSGWIKNFKVVNDDNLIVVTGSVQYRQEKMVGVSMILGEKIEKDVDNSIYYVYIHKLKSDVKVEKAKFKEFDSNGNVIFYKGKKLLSVNISDGTQVEYKE